MLKTSHRVALLDFPFGKILEVLRQIFFCSRSSSGFVQQQGSKMIYGSKSPSTTLTSPVFVLFFFFFVQFFSPLTPVFNDLEHKGHMFMDPQPHFDERRCEGHGLCEREQFLKSPFGSLLCTQTSAEQRAGTLVCVKLSAIAAIIRKFRTFHCALSLHHCASPIRLEACWWKVHMLKYCTQV